MTAIDYVIIALILFFALLSFSRGLIKEIVAILKWVFSVLGARLMYVPFSELFFNSIEPAWLKQTVGFGTFFLVFYIILNFFGRGLNRIIRSLGLDGVDRLLGVVFGILKGVIVVTLVVFIVSYTSIVNTDIWQQSKLLPFFNTLIGIFSPFVQDMLNSK